MVVRQAEESVDIALALDGSLLVRLEAMAASEVLADEGLADALPAVEGLSHLLYLAEAVRRGRPVSPLELETQAEVDKLALCLFHRRDRAAAGFDALIERLFYRFALARDLSPELRARYETANRLALAFARGLERDVRAGRWHRLRSRLKRFWGGTLMAKRGLVQAT